MGEVNDRFRVYLPIQTATIHRDGKVKIRRWWVYKKNKGLLAIKWSRKDIVAQCSPEKAFTKKLIETLYPDHEIVFMDIVFMAHFNDLEPRMEP